MSDKEQRIRTRAYEIYEQDGRHDGRAEEHWQSGQTRNRARIDVSAGTSR